MASVAVELAGSDRPLPSIVLYIVRQSVLLGARNAVSMPETRERWASTEQSCCASCARGSWLACADLGMEEAERSGDEVSEAMRARSKFSHEI